MFQKFVWLATDGSPLSASTIKNTGLVCHRSEAGQLNGVPLARGSLCANLITTSLRRAVQVKRDQPNRGVVWVSRLQLPIRLNVTALKLSRDVITGVGDYGLPLLWCKTHPIHAPKSWAPVLRYRDHPRVQLLRKLQSLVGHTTVQEDGLFFFQKDLFAVESTPSTIDCDWFDRMLRRSLGSPHRCIVLARTRGQMDWFERDVRRIYASRVAVIRWPEKPDPRDPQPRFLLIDRRYQSEACLPHWPVVSICGDYFPSNANGPASWQAPFPVLAKKRLMLKDKLIALDRTRWGWHLGFDETD
ncbi:MAG: hypothetical protein KDC35_00805 [Acidobacteria bacterium]|nr:hypothetical protein [Acidobacteriota bacterium]